MKAWTDVGMSEVEACPCLAPSSQALAGREAPALKILSNRNDRIAHLTSYALFAKFQFLMKLKCTTPYKIVCTCIRFCNFLNHKHILSHSVPVWIIAVKICWWYLSCQILCLRGLRSNHNITAAPLINLLKLCSSKTRLVKIAKWHSCWNESHNMLVYAIQDACRLMQCFSTKSKSLRKMILHKLVSTPFVSSTSPFSEVLKEFSKVSNVSSAPALWRRNIYRSFL